MDDGWDGRKAQFFRDDFGAEIAFADEKRHDEDARRGDFSENFFDVRFLFPERFANFGEDFPAAQFRRVLQNRRGGLVVQGRAVAENDQRRIGKVLTVHPLELAQGQAVRKPATPGAVN